MTDIKLLRTEMKKYSNKKRAAISQKYFKTRPREYGEGDVFIGLTVPESREISVKFRELKMDQVKKTKQEEARYTISTLAIYVV